jgi:hypothetical protein
MTERDAVTVALDALRGWRELNDDRDRLVAAADAAGASQVAISEAAGLHRNTVNHILKAQEDRMTTTATRTDDPLAGLHHPHYVSHTHHPGRDPFIGEYDFVFRPFTGTEPEPLNLDDGRYRPEFGAVASADIGQWNLLVNEYWQARGQWVVAKFKYDVRQALLEAKPVWEAYTAARALMDALFDQFRDLSDDRWNSQTLRLLEAHDQAVDAAKAWDAVAENLIGLQTAHEHDEIITHGWTRAEAATIADAADAAGIDISDWKIGESGDYVLAAPGDDAIANRTPLHSDVHEAIKAQRQRLEQVMAITGRSHIEQ